MKYGIPESPLLPPGAAATQAYDQAMAQHQQGNLAEAARLYQAVLARDGRHFGALYRFGMVCAQQGRLEDAVRLVRKALNQNPKSAEAHNNLGTVLRALGRFDEAIGRCEKALAIDPNYAEACHNLAVTLHEAGRQADAIGYYERALGLRPDQVEVHNGLGIALRELGRADEAVGHYETALALRPNYAEACNNLGNALKDLDRLEDAVARYEQAIALKPDYFEAHSNLAVVLQELKRPDAALPHCEAALALRPDFAEAHHNLGNALQSLNRLDEALDRYRQALVLAPDYADAHNNLGSVLETLGDIAQARQAYEAALALAPRRVRTHRNLADIKRFSADDPQLATLETLAQDVAAMKRVDQIELHFALGKACGDLGQHERAFHHLRAGNALKRETIGYDETATLALLDRVRAVCTAELMRARRGAGHPSTMPVFIFGMPRSGTSLVEQILASHPAIHGAGELPDFAGLVASRFGADGAGLSSASVTEDALRDIGAFYLAGVCAAAPAAARITDKMPANFRFAGLIHLALPGARLIHVRRDPVDTCWSCFAHSFEHDQNHTYELGELGRYYRAYAALMAHWRAVIPEDAMIEVQYETLVDDLEGQARRLVGHCGVEWDEACLGFHRTRRAVRTASAAQVRQPIYRNSVGRGRSYLALLQPLVDALGPAVAGGGNFATDANSAG